MDRGKRIVITGGTKGIGKDLALFLLQEGHKVVICSRNEEEVHMARQVLPFSENCYGIGADITNEEDCKKLASFADTSMGGIDVLINNAGVLGEVKPFSKSNSKAWEEAIRVNIFGTANSIRAMLPYMIKLGKGNIINMAGGGVGGRKPLTNRSAYFTSKMAVVGLTENLAYEFKSSHIKINCIAPGAINTELTEYLLKQGVENMGQSLYEETMAQKEKGGDSLEDVRRMVEFLISEESDHLTGKLLSAKWDKKSRLLKVTEDDLDIFTLRRIDNELFTPKI